MKKEQTIFAGYIKPLKLKLRTTTENVKLNLYNKINWFNINGNRLPFAGVIKPLKLKLKTSTEDIELNLRNKIKRFKLKTNKNRFEDLNKIPTIKINGISFYSQPKLTIKNNTKQRIYSTSKIFNKQSEMLYRLFEERKEEIRKTAEKKYNNIKK